LALAEAARRADPDLTEAEIGALVGALRLQHEDPEAHDRSLIAERLSWSPDERLRALQTWLAMVDQARPRSAR